MRTLVLWQRQFRAAKNFDAESDEWLRRNFFEISLAPVLGSSIFLFTFFTSEAGSGGRFQEIEDASPLPIRKAILVARSNTENKVEQTC